MKVVHHEGLFELKLPTDSVICQKVGVEMEVIVSGRLSNAQETNITCFLSYIKSKL